MLSEKKKIAVITGTFNPVTRAHIMLGKIAKEKLQADMVIYVPAKDSFLSGWKSLEKGDMLPQDLRFSMLCAACREEQFQVEACEIEEKVSGKTFDTMKYLADRYETEQLWYVIGTDKLPELYSWYKSEELLKLVHFLIVLRNEDEPEKIIAGDEFLAKNLLPGNYDMVSCDRIRKISATQVRQELKRENPDFRMIQELVPDAAFELLRQEMP